MKRYQRERWVIPVLSLQRCLSLPELFAVHRSPFGCQKGVLTSAPYSVTSGYAPVHCRRRRFGNVKVLRSTAIRTSFDREGVVADRQVKSHHQPFVVDADIVAGVEIEPYGPDSYQWTDNDPRRRQTCPSSLPVWGRLTTSGACSRCPAASWHNGNSPRKPTSGLRPPSRPMLRSRTLCLQPLRPMLRSRTLCLQPLRPMNARSCLCGPTPAGTRMSSPNIPLARTMSA